VLRERGVELSTGSRWVETSAACLAALAEAEWDVAVCFAEGATLSPAVRPLLEDVERPPLVVVTEAPSAMLTAEVLRHCASIATMPGDDEVLAEAVRRAANAAAVRRGRRHAALFGEGQRDVLERIARGAPLPEVLERIVRLVEGRQEDLICSCSSDSPSPPRRRARECSRSKKGLPGPQGTKRGATVTV
jgi:hypothetical protein